MGLCSAGADRRSVAPSPSAARTAALTAILAACCVWPFSARAAELAAADAVHHVGETATVCGTVASAKFDNNLRSQPTFLDFDKPYPDEVFTAVIFGSDRNKFGTPETALRDKRICVTGKIQDRNGLPEMILNDPKQLTE